MKLITAIRIIEEREKIKRKTKKKTRRRVIPFRINFINEQDSNLASGQKDLIYVQSLFSEEEVVALKEKTKEAYIKKAILKAIYFYLKSDVEDDNYILDKTTQKKQEVGKVTKFVHVQSLLPQEDVIALKQKTGEGTVKEAISKAVHYYLKYGQEK